MHVGCGFDSRILLMIKPFEICLNTSVSRVFLFAHDHIFDNVNMRFTTAIRKKVVTKMVMKKAPQKCQKCAFEVPSDSVFYIIFSDVIGDSLRKRMRSHGVGVVDIGLLPYAWRVVLL